MDAKGIPLAIVLTDGQRNDGAVFTEVIDDIRAPWLGAGRPRTRPDAVIADKVYSKITTCPPGGQSGDPAEVQREELSEEQRLNRR